MVEDIYKWNRALSKNREVLEKERIEFCIRKETERKVHKSNQRSTIVSH